jgi:heme A synthase
MKSKAFAGYAWTLVVYTIFVILWGVVVRATGSGAGCGSHWPTCNGEVLPALHEMETVIEYGHRLTSGAMGILVIALVVWAWRIYGRASHITKAAIASLVLTIVEGGIGALLVRAELVADNASVARAIVIALHLVNTYILLTAVVATAWWASGHPTLQIKGQPVRLVWLLGGGVLMMAILGATGAVTALGDTLFPVASLAEGFQQDLDPAAHFLVQLRVVHPAMAILTGFYIVITARIVREWRTNSHTTILSHATSLLFFAQLAVGALNLGLLAPIWMQLIHLLMADLIWMVYILLAIAALNPAWLIGEPQTLRSGWWRVPSSFGD